MIYLTIFSQITEVGPDGRLEPLLAESYEPSADAATWTFKLRKGVEFHDGKPFTAQDVIGTMQYHALPDSKSPAKGIVEQISDMKAIGNHEIVFVLKNGNADFPFMLAAPQLGILPVRNGKLDSSSGIGTGAYKVKGFNPGVQIDFERNTNFFRDDRGFFESGTVLTIADTTARMGALTTGQVDIIDRVDVRTADLAKQQPGVEVLDVVGTLHYTFPMRTDIAPFNSNDVRLALKYALDREAFLKNILFGYGTLGNDHPISPANRYCATELSQRIYDPDKAKFHARKAGFPSLTVDLSAADAGFPGAVDAAVLYKEQAAKAGITINVVREPNDGYWANIWMKKPWCACYWSGRPTEDWMFTDAYSSDSAWNDSYWKNERFNSLLREARAILDESKRKEIYLEMQRLVNEDGGVAVPMFANHLIGYSDQIAHPTQVAGNWDKDGGKLFERWWMAG